MTLTVDLNGLTVGTGTAYGVAIRGTNWRATPDLRANHLDHAGRHGVRAGRDLLGSRRFTIIVQIEEDTMAEALEAERLVAAAWGPSDVDVPIVITDDNGAWRMTGRPQLGMPDLSHADAGLIEVECRFAATDPLLYTDTEASDSTGFPAGGSGRTYSRTYPRVYGAAGTGGLITAENEGTIAVPWRAEITGPWTNPTILHVGSGRQLTINVTLAAAEVLTIDSAVQSILLGGTASRFSSLVQPATWFDLEPGTNEVRFGGASGTGTAELSWRSGWI